MVERVAPALEAKRQTKSQAAAAKRKAKREREVAREVERWTVGGKTPRDNVSVDLQRMFALAINLPSLRPARRTKWKSMHRSVEHPFSVSGRAWPLSDKIHMTIGTHASAADAVGVLLHELAHVACSCAGEPYGDNDRAFARRCLDAHDEWNARHGKIVTVDRDGRGSPYRGDARKRRDRRRQAASEKA